jgi:hypothetical protein
MRSVDDMLKLADDYDAYIADDVKIAFIDNALYEHQFGSNGNSHACFQAIHTKSLDQQLTFMSVFTDKDGNTTARCEGFFNP